MYKNFKKNIKKKYKEELYKSSYLINICKNNNKYSIFIKKFLMSNFGKFYFKELFPEFLIDVNKPVSLENIKKCHIRFNVSNDFFNLIIKGEGFETQGFCIIYGIFDEKIIEQILLFKEDNNEKN